MEFETWASTGTTTGKKIAYLCDPAFVTINKDNATLKTIMHMAQNTGEHKRQESNRHFYAA